MPCPEHVREKIRLSNLGQTKSAEAREKMSIAKKGKHLINDGSFLPGQEPWNKNLKGIHLSSASEFKPGRKPHNWKGGRIINKGYYAVLSHGHPHATAIGYVLEHRLVMEKKLGRYLLPSEIVHHIDGDKLNNHPDNLCLITREKHKMGYGNGFKEGYDRGFAAAFVLLFLQKAQSIRATDPQPNTPGEAVKAG